jgi:hypothetical protein
MSTLVYGKVDLELNAVSLLETSFEWSSKTMNSLDVEVISDDSKGAGFD